MYTYLLPHTYKMKKNLIIDLPYSTSASKNKNKRKQKQKTNNCIHSLTLAVKRLTLLIYILFYPNLEGFPFIS